MTTAAVNWPPRLARLYGEDIKRLEAVHASRLSTGTRTWEAAIKALYEEMSGLGPVKGAKLLKQAVDYLNAVAPEDRGYLVLASRIKSRNGYLVVATFSVGNHPDPAVTEEGLSIALHVVHCSRARPMCAVGVPVAFVSRHALKRIYEHSDTISESSHVSSALAFIAVAGYLTHRSAKHRGGGLYMRFSDLLAAGHLHRFNKIWPKGCFEECIFDVRTMLPPPARRLSLDAMIGMFLVCLLLSLGGPDRLPVFGGIGLAVWGYVWLWQRAPVTVQVIAIIASMIVLAMLGSGRGRRRW